MLFVAANFQRSCVCCASSASFSSSADAVVECHHNCTVCCQNCTTYKFYYSDLSATNNLRTFVEIYFAGDKVNSDHMPQVTRRIRRNKMDDQNLSQSASFQKNQNKTFPNLPMLQPDLVCSHVFTIDI